MAAQVYSEPSTPNPEFDRDAQPHHALVPVVQAGLPRTPNLKRYLAAKLSHFEIELIAAPDSWGMSKFGVQVRPSMPSRLCLLIWLPLTNLLK